MNSSTSIRYSTGIIGFFDRINPKSDPNWAAVARHWANPHWSAICFVFLAFTLIHPVDGLPIRLCLFHFLYGVDCPGCGMTRGLSHLWRGHLQTAHVIHPFALATFIYLAFCSANLFLTKGARERVIQMMNRWNTQLVVGFWAVLGMFLAFGTARAIFQLIVVPPAGRLPSHFHFPFG